jgi:histone acetyltransferase (RNA polymerase elongator complex component)
MPRRPFIIPVFVPHAGCPHRCVFCNQKSITGHEEAILSPAALTERITEFLGLKGLRRGSVEVAFYGGNFLGLPTRESMALLDEAQNFVRQGKVDSLRFSTRPDTVSLSTIGTLDPYSVGTVELGAQSMDDAVLRLSRRGHTAEDTCRAVGLLKSKSLFVGIQIMPGLPGDTRDSILKTGFRVASLKPDFVRIYPTVVVKDTLLESWFLSGLYEPLSLGQAVKMTKELLLLFKKHNIPVVRMGLQATDSLLKPGNIVAGPFHPAFGHLVYSEFFLDLAIRAVEGQERLSKRIGFRVFPEDVPKLVGQNRENIKRLTSRFKLRDICVIADPQIPKNTVRIERLVE